MAIIAIDVDQTVVSIADKWYNWLRLRYEFNDLNFYHDVHWDQAKYDISKYFDIPNNSNPYSFFDLTNLYDNLDPIENSQKFINKLQEDGHDLIFVSHVYPGHYQSKIDFLKKYFGDIPLIATEHKQYVKADFFVDDRKKFLINIKKHNPQAKCLLFASPFVNEESESFPLVKDWQQVYNAITSIVNSEK